MEFIDQAALRMQALEAYQHLPPLPKTAQELLLDPSDPNTDADDESEASGILGDGGSIADLSEVDLCLTGRGAPRQGAVPAGNGGGKVHGSWGGQGRDRNGMYGRNWEVGTGTVGIVIGIGSILHIARVTWAPFRVLMGPETPLLAILIHALRLILLHINHRMPEVAFNPCPACRMEVKAGV